MTPKRQRMQRLHRRLQLRVYRFNSQDRCIACGCLVRLHFYHGRKLDCHQVRQIR